MTEENPKILMFAGPNGSGKSSLTNIIMKSGHEMPALYINADDIAKDRGLNALEAAKESTRLRNEAIESRQSFVMETVLSARDKIEFMQAAKEKGYEIHLVYATIRDPSINIDRVSNRILKGGHDVPVDKIISRYGRSMELVSEAAKIADTARIYNNSFEKPVLIAEKSMEHGWEVYQQASSLWTEKNTRNLLKIDPPFKEISIKGKDYIEIEQGKLNKPLRGTYFGDIEHEGRAYHRIEDPENKKHYLVPATEKGLERNLLLRRVEYDGVSVAKIQDKIQAKTKDLGIEKGLEK